LTLAPARRKLARPAETGLAGAHARRSRRFVVVCGIVAEGEASVMLEYGLLGSAASGVQGAVSATVDALATYAGDLVRLVADNPLVVLILISVLAGLALFRRQR